MKVIQVAEQGFARVNTFYYLMWAVITVVGLTAFFEARGSNAEKAQAEKVIEFYSNLNPLTAKVHRDLVERLVEDFAPKTESEALLLIRSSSVQSQRAVLAASDAFSERLGVSTADRLEVNAMLNELVALHFYNDPTGRGELYTSLEDRPALRLVEHSVGNMRIAETVAALRIEDASRYLWLSTIPIQQIVDRADELVLLAEKGDIGALKALLSDWVNTPDFEDERNNAEALWKLWSSRIPAGGASANAAIERRAQQQLLLADPVRLTVEAYKKQVKAEARLTGKATDVKLPIFTVPVRLIDALVFLPWIIAFCLAAIIVYAARGLRYSAQIEPVDLSNATKDTELVGVGPIYMDVFSYVSEKAGWLLGVLLSLAMLLAPWAIAGALPFFVPFIALDSNGTTDFYYQGFLLGLVLLLVHIGQVVQVANRKTDGGIVKAAMTNRDR